MTRISKITIGRLYNLGNFEHVRYEFSVEVDKHASPGEVLKGMEKIMEDLNPKGPVEQIELSRCREQLSKPVERVSEHELRNIQYYKSQIEKADAWSELRKNAFLKLNEFGGNVEHRDDKQNWDEGY